MAQKAAQKVEYGDFQTPERLATEVCALLADQGIRPATILEPTCGMGNFLFAGLDRFQEAQRAVGVDIRGEYIDRARSASQRRPDAHKIRLLEADFFATDWDSVFFELPEPILVIGNLPWVTSAQLSTLGSDNVPAKSNFQKRRGMDAITGKANFDISEWMLIRLLEALSGRGGALAMLCKSSVARKVLFHGWKNGMRFSNARLCRIEANQHFGVAVDASLLVAHFIVSSGRDRQARVCSSLDSNAATDTVMGYEDGMLIADMTAYARWKHLCGDTSMIWRSGIKHDCSGVMELRKEGHSYRNGLGELVEIEDTYVFPMLKSSHVARGRSTENRYMLVTQRTVGEDTGVIKDRAPRTWDYLVAHAGALNKRASAIYKKRPPFSIFGVGRYTFAPWKVAISGFYKKLAFAMVAPFQHKPVVLDDTSYFLPCETQAQADYLAGLLNSPAARDFYKSFVFWDTKRPITVDLLRRLDLRRLAHATGSGAVFDMHFGEPESALYV